MVVEALDPPIPPRVVRAGAKTGPKGRDDVFRPADCPDRHGGRIRIDRIAASGPFHTRVGYRCCRWVWNTKKGRWTEARHRLPFAPLGDAPGRTEDRAS